MASSMVEDSSFEDDQLASMSTDDIARASRLLDNEIRILKVSILSLFLFIYVSFCDMICYFDERWWWYGVEGGVAEDEHGVGLL